MVGNSRKEKVELEAENILIQMYEIKEKFPRKGVRLRLASNLASFTAFLFFTLLMVGACLNLNRLGITVVIAIVGVYLSYSAFLLEDCKNNNEYNYSYKVKSKETVNELMVAIKNIKKKGVKITVLKINAQYNDKNMYLEIIYQ